MLRFKILPNSKKKKKCSSFYSSVVLNWGQFCTPFPGNILQYLETCLVVATGWLLLTSNGYRAEMLLNILNCTGGPPKTVICHKMSVVTKVKYPVAYSLICYPKRFWLFSAIKLHIFWQINSCFSPLIDK